MGDRYFLAARVSDEGRSIIRRLAAERPAYAIVLDAPGLIVVAEPSASVIQLGDTGVIIGSLRASGRRETRSSLPHDVATLILSTRGGHLCRAYWGDYIAVLLDEGSTCHVARAPFGALPVLHVHGADKHIFASDIRLLERFGNFQPRVDWERVARFAAAPDVRTPETCLECLDEVPGGSRLTIRAIDSDAATLWSPWTFAHPDAAIYDRDEAEKRLRETILTAMGSVAGRADRCAILLSGGLDSSIVAASATASGIDATCVTISTSAASGDERRFARVAAGGIGLPLVERAFELSGVDLAVSDAANCPRPVAQAFEVEGRRQSKAVARSIGATAIYSGGGGDNVFCSLQSVAGAVDCLDDKHGRHAFWQVSRDLSQLTGASLMTIARRAWLRSRQRDRQYPRPFDPLFLSQRAIDWAAPGPLHPWLCRESPVPQGKGAHVAALLGVQCLTEDSDPLDPLALRYPLLAQPVVELCLRIPTWMWYAHGCNRAVARSAFSNELPHEIAWRRSKGTPDSFVIDMYDERRDQIRSMLLDGNLAGHGLLDRVALTQLIDDHRPVRGTDYNRVMRLVDVEAWTCCWPS